MALGLTDDFDERSTLFLIGGLATTLGGLAGASLPAYIAQSDYVYLMLVASCLFFATDAPYVTGQILAVDGGRSIGW